MEGIVAQEVADDAVVVGARTAPEVAMRAARTNCGVQDAGALGPTWKDV